jgi:hypothetical protein
VAATNSSGMDDSGKECELEKVFVTAEHPPVNCTELSPKIWLVRGFLREAEAVDLPYGPRAGCLGGGEYGLRML